MPVLNLKAVLRSERANGAHTLADSFVQIEGRRLSLILPGVCAGQREEVFDDASQPAPFIKQDGKRFAILFRASGCLRERDF